MKLKNNSPICEHCGWDERIPEKDYQLPFGTVLNDQYIVGRILGVSGFDITYLGYDKFLDTNVVIKEYFPYGKVIRQQPGSCTVKPVGDRELEWFQRNRERFLREAKALSRLSRIERIVQIRNFFLANDTAYIIMEYVPGISLKDYIRRNGSLSLDTTLKMLRPLMTSLVHVHKEGFIHRNISPENIVLMPNGTLKLMEFGSVRHIGAEQTTDPANPTMAVVRGGYSPVEQYNNIKLGPWTDVYALCATIVFCVSAQQIADAPERILSGTALGLEHWIGDPNIVAALTHGLEPRPEKRTQNVELLCQELFPAPVPTDVTRPVEVPAQPEPIQPEKKSFPKWAMALILALIVGIGALIGFHPWDKTDVNNPAVRDEKGPDLLDTNVPVNTLMERILENAEEPDQKAFGTQAANSEVIAISIVDTLADAPADAVDVSYLKNGKVKAWTVKKVDGYHLYIGAEGGVYAPAESFTLFGMMPNVRSIDFGGCFYTDNVEDMSYMFYGLSHVETLDVTGFNTSGVRFMKETFSGMRSLKQLDVSGFDTAMVQTMQAMFRECSALQTLDVSGFDTSSVTSFASMFSHCSGLKQLDVSGFDTAAAEDLSHMFRECNALQMVDVSGFNTASVTDFSFMFHGCAVLSQLDVSGFNTSRAENLESMFRECQTLTELDVTGFNTSHVEDFSSMFSGCSGLKALDVTNFSTGNARELSWMFSLCGGLKQLDVSGFQTGSVTTMERMFQSCGSLQELDVSGFDTHNVTSMNGMFYECSNLTQLDVSGFDTRNVTDMAAAFYRCAGLKKLDVSGFDTRKVTAMDNMFHGCSSLTNLDVSRFDTAKVENMEAMFSECSNLKRLDVRKFNTARVTSMRNMFHKCYELKVLQVERWDTSRVKSMNGMFHQCSKLNYLDVSRFDTGSVTDMQFMFSGCADIIRLDVKDFDTSAVTSMSHMFSDCTKLSELDVSRFRTACVTDFSGMFRGCGKLTYLNVQSFDTTAAQDMSYMFYGCGAANMVRADLFDTSSVTSSENFMEDGMTVNGQPWQDLFQA